MNYPHFQSSGQKQMYIPSIEGSSSKREACGFNIPGLSSATFTTIIPQCHMKKLTEEQRQFQAGDLEKFEALYVYGEKNDLGTLNCSGRLAKTSHIAEDRVNGEEQRAGVQKPADSGVDTLAVFMASSGTTDVTNRNSPATPPNTLNLRSSHNELLNAEIKQSDAKNSTPPKCRKKYALTNIQAAMGLSDPAVQPLLGNGSANIKLVKNGENQLRKAAEQGQQDPNKNHSPTAVVNLTSEKLEVKDLHPPESSGCEILPSQPRRTKSFLNYYADLETSARELGQNLGSCHGVGEEKAQPGPGQAPVVIENGDLLQKPDRPQSSPEDGQVATVSSSPETKKDHPKTGAKTDCALHRIQNLAPSDEESSWTTLSQDSASPSSPDETATTQHRLLTEIKYLNNEVPPEVQDPIQKRTKFTQHQSNQHVKTMYNWRKLRGIDSRCGEDSRTSLVAFDQKNETAKALLSGGFWDLLDQSIKELEALIMGH
ncbi:hypothetical protein STEG23_015075 [Scotinomys teguina]